MIKTTKRCIGLSSLTCWATPEINGVGAVSESLAEADGATIKARADIAAQQIVVPQEAG